MGKKSRIVKTDKSFIFKLIAYHLNPIWTRRGIFCPDQQISSAVSTCIALHSPNFLTLFLSMSEMSQQSHFWHFFLNIVRCKKCPKGALLCKKKIFKKKKKKKKKKS